jgi:uncharacterized protein (DUF2236 family)
MEEQSYSRFIPLFTRLNICKEQWPPSFQQVDSLWRNKAKELHPDKTNSAEAIDQVL